MRSSPLSAFAATAACLVACTIPPSNAMIGGDSAIPLLLPSESVADWQPVADYLDHRCGALDCHGDLQRNLVIWGCDGLRFSPTDVPGCRTGPNAPNTTSDEYDATYRSLVGLEPLVMSQVLTGGGQEPDLLTFVRKARGEENHKGGALIVPGDAQDICITSWLAGSTNATACTQAIDTTP